MAVPHLFLICTGLKLLIILLTIAVLILLDPSYVSTYISVNYEIIYMYLVAALTIVYCLASMIMYAVMSRREEEHMTNCSISEVIFGAAGMMGWLVICGIGASVSQSTILETGEAFGWISGCSGIIVSCFIALCAVSALKVLNEKVFLPGGRSSKYQSSMGRS